MDGSYRLNLSNEYYIRCELTFNVARAIFVIDKLHGNELAAIFLIDDVVLNGCVDPMCLVFIRDGHQFINGYVI